MTRRPRDLNHTDSGDLLRWLCQNPGKWSELSGRFVIFHKRKGVLVVGDSILEVTQSVPQEEYADSLLRRVPREDQVDAHTWKRALAYSVGSTEELTVDAIIKYIDHVCLPHHSEPRSELKRKLQDGKWREFLVRD